MMGMHGIYILGKGRYLILQRTEDIRYCLCHAAGKFETTRHKRVWRAKAANSYLTVRKWETARLEARPHRGSEPKSSALRSRPIFRTATLTRVPLQIIKVKIDYVSCAIRTVYEV
ncbi:hypothetical protein L484_023036 [Morus notabilis]|uniref:Uncharacterized protein n=1 Tax=Morus notabilis TaxID=981085 RepID=W9RTB4_9ROSA|nr:hypothetical protein L484_023036 [Morus notabilis]